MTKGMIIYILAVLILSTTSGIFIKMKSLGATGKTLLFSPFVVPLVFVFNFIYGLKILKRKKHSRETYKIFWSILLLSFKRLSLLSGMVCVIIVDIQRDAEKRKVKNPRRYYSRFENNLNRSYNEILCT